MKNAYLFEAHSIQPYILDSGKLTQMVGASEIIEELIGVNGPLDIVLKEMQLSLDNDYCFARRGGGAFFMLFNDPAKAKQLMEVWCLIVNGFAPGLEYCHACCFDAKTQGEAIKAAQNKMRTQRNQLKPELPEAGPWVRRSPRTGRPAVKKITESGGSQVWADKASVFKQKDRFAKGKKLNGKFLSNEMAEKFQFPRNLDQNSDDGKQFPFNGENHNIGIIHADGNGLGEILIELAKNIDQAEDEYAKVFYQLSQRIDTATQAAARRALFKEAKLFESRVLPVRPLILGGDDLTVIVRADFALEYARDFITFFEQETLKELAELHNNYPAIPKQMTACAGVAFLKSNQPFSLGYALAETLCSAAKAQSRKNKVGPLIPSSLIFHRVTSSCIDVYDFALERELTAKQGEEKIQLTLGAYGVGDYAEKLPGFDVLYQLKQFFSQAEMAKGPTRQFLTLLSTDIFEASDAWRRWRKNIKKPLLVDYDALVRDLYQIELADKEGMPLFNSEGENSYQKTFVGDLINWIAASGENAA